MIKIQVHDIAPHGGCSYYRGIGPLSKLKNNIFIEYNDQIGWHKIVDTDIVFFERPSDWGYRDGIQYCKDFGIKVWIDIDDLLHGIPKTNPSYIHFGKEETQKCIEQCLSLADVVTVATKDLKIFYEKFNSNIHVIPNAHNDYNYPWKLIENHNPFVNWRGSNTHRKDLLSIANQLISISKKYQSWYFSFLGDDTWYVAEHINNPYCQPESDLISYFNLLKSLLPAIHIIPLIDNDFNRAKSNCSWIEGTYAGAAVIAPDFSEFRRPGITNYKDATDFGNKLELLMNDESLRQKLYTQSFEYIRDNLLLSKINEKRLKIIKDLLLKK